MKVDSDRWPDEIFAGCTPDWKNKINCSRGISRHNGDTIEGPPPPKPFGTLLRLSSRLLKGGLNWSQMVPRNENLAGHVGYHK